ncbi:XdhC family protein [Stagnihabitans tardus]|uniref:XdhC/CoxI family protein n=1 Tax=Stagnihabitans tardus TaxID=2699202 RepID=A0AAE4YBA7_9RHOB|nr:XdhC/CoxI family protein [Stagnihabitans tardus]NBZ87119.1 XdhC/CoxI family protein [Stagnihabitans tardus]
MENFPELALEWHRAGRGAVLATVIETWGSAPRRVGSQLVIDGQMAMEGSVSGGCVEGAVVEEAMVALEDLRPRVLTFGVTDDQAFAVGLACGGTIRILLEPLGALPEALLAELVAHRAARTPVAYQVNLSTWERRLVAPDAETAALFRADKSGVTEDIFTHIHNPPLRLAVIGAVHIAQHLVPMAQACGFDTLVIDPREAFGAEARFPGTRLSHDWPDEALTEFAPDARTAIVTLTHDPKLDDPGLRAALASPAFYIGCLGSTRTHAKRLDRLQGLDTSRLRAPVGLNIGAATPAEIAVSILAQIIESLRRP